MSVLYFSVFGLQIRMFLLVEYIEIDQVISKFLRWFGNLDELE